MDSNYDFIHHPQGSRVETELAPSSAETIDCRETKAAGTSAQQAGCTFPRSAGVETRVAPRSLGTGTGIHRLSCMRPQGTVTVHRLLSGPQHTEAVGDTCEWGREAVASPADNEGVPPSPWPGGQRHVGLDAWKRQMSGRLGGWGPLDGQLGVGGGTMPQF